MKHLIHKNSLDRLLVVSVCATSIAIGACSEISAKSEKQTEAQSCEHLNSLIADHPNKFSHYRKNLSTHRLLNVWSAVKVFPNAENCQVWEWSTGLFNYVCEWSTGNNQNQAMNNYQDGVNIIQQCLGETWAAQTSITKSGGKSTFFSTPNNPTIVEIRYFQYLRSWSIPWQNTIIICDKNNLKSPLQ